MSGAISAIHQFFYTKSLQKKEEKKKTTAFSLSMFLCSLSERGEEKREEQVGKEK
jgi:hypothetical protein